jgi:hypothetical protein
MSDTLQHLKIVFRDNFGSAMFLLVTGTVAFLFIGYLLIDYFRSLVLNFRMKQRHRHESRERTHHHS